MARPEKALLNGSDDLAALANYLREGRRGKRLTYGRLADRTGGYSATTLQRAASGRLLPSREVARAYGHVCGLDIDHVDRLWEAAYREQQSARGQPLPSGVPPHLVYSLADLSAALVALHATRGAPSLRLMHKRACRHTVECTPLSTSTLHRILRRKAVPTSKEGLRAFLIGCGLPLEQHSLWEGAAERARRNHRRATAQERQATADLEARLAEEATRRLTPERATHLLREAGFYPAEPYRGFTVPWTVGCVTCQEVRRVRLSETASGPRPCSSCRQ